MKQHLASEFHPGDASMEAEILSRPLTRHYDLELMEETWALDKVAEPGEVEERERTKVRATLDTRNPSAKKG